MKFKILDYINKQDENFVSFKDNHITVDYSYNPVRAVVLCRLIKKYFNIKNSIVFLHCVEYQIGG